MECLRPLKESKVRHAVYTLYIHALCPMFAMCSTLLYCCCMIVAYSNGSECDGDSGRGLCSQYMYSAAMEAGQKTSISPPAIGHITGQKSGYAISYDQHRENLNTSPICAPGDLNGFSDAEEEAEPTPYKSPSIKQKALKHEADKEAQVRNRVTETKAVFARGSNKHLDESKESESELSSRGEQQERGGLHYSRNPRKVEYR